MGYVYFSELSSSTEIRAHCGPTNVKVRILYPLLIERDTNATADDDAFITIANERRDFVVGEPLVFDDSFYHSVHIGHGVRRRLALVIDIWHPEIKGEDIRSAITATFPVMEDNDVDDDRVIDAVATMLGADSVIQGHIDGSNNNVAITVDGESVIIGEGALSVGDNDGVEAIAISTSGATAATPVATAMMVLENPISTINSHISGQLKGYGELYPANDYFITESSRYFSEVIDEYRFMQEALASDTPSSQPNYDYLFKFLMIGDSGVGKSAFVLRAVDDTYTDSFYSTIGVDFKIRTECVLNPLLFPTETVYQQLQESSNGEEHATNTTTIAPVVATPTDDIASTKKMDDKEKLPSNEKSSKKIFEIKNQIWDTSGPERFRTITSSYYRGAHGIFVMYDISNRESFNNIPLWLGEIRKYAHEEVIAVLIGTKVDLDCEDEKVSNTRSLETRQVSYEEGLRLAQQYQLPAFLEVSSKNNFQVQDAFCTIVSLVLKRMLLDGQFVPASVRNNNINRNNRNQPARGNTRCILS